MTLVRRLWLGSLELTDYPYAVSFGSDYGNPENVGVVLESLLADGEIESLTRRSNRTLTITIQVQGADLAEIHENEAALIAECDRLQNTLTVDPGDGFAASTVFRTFAAQANRVMGDGDDEREMAGLHLWALTIKALPFGFSETETVDDAGTPPLSGGDVVYEADHTDWSFWPGAAYSSPGDSAYAAYSTDAVVVPDDATAAVKSQAQTFINNYGAFSSGSFGSSGVSLSVNADSVTFPTPIDTDTGGYLALPIRLDTELDFGGFFALTSGVKRIWMTVDGVGEIEVESFAETTRDSVGFVRHVWLVDAGLSVTAARFEVMSLDWPGRASRPFVRYGDIELLPSASTDHQIVKQHFVEGSARTTGSLQISSPSEEIALDKVLAITTPTSAVPTGFQPDGARWVTQGTTTPDGSALAGYYYSPDASSYLATTGKPIFDVPVGMLTAGPYMMVSLVKVESSPTVAGVQAQLLVDGTEVGATSTAEVSIPNLATGWTFIPVGTVDLPPTPVQNADDTTKVRLLFKGAKLADVYFIPAWEVGGLPVADYSIVDCGTGTVEPGGASSSLFIDAPSLTQPQGAFWRGPTTDRANAQKLNRRTELLVPGVHKFPPGSLTNFVVSLGAAGPTSTLRYFAAHYMMATS